MGQRNLMIIGEAESKMSEETRQGYPNIPWVGIIDVRNIIPLVFKIVWGENP